MRDLLKNVATVLATLAVTPRIVAFHLSSLLIGADRALEGATQSLARIPGVRGQYLRRAFLPYAGVECDRSATVCFGTVFSKVGTVLEKNVYVGPYCSLGLAHLGENVLIAAGVHIPSGARLHRIDDPTMPIREQHGEARLVRIGSGTWVGSAAVVLSDVGRNCVIGAGAVVTTPIPDEVVAVGVPAKVIRSRVPSPASTDTGLSAKYQPQ